MSYYGSIDDFGLGGLLQQSASGQQPDFSQSQGNTLTIPSIAATPGMTSMPGTLPTLGSISSPFAPTLSSSSGNAFAPTAMGSGGGFSLGSLFGGGGGGFGGLGNLFGGGGLGSLFGGGGQGGGGLFNLAGLSGLGGSGGSLSSGWGSLLGSTGSGGLGGALSGPFSVLGSLGGSLLGNAIGGTGSNFNSGDASMGGSIGGMAGGLAGLALTPFIGPFGPLLGSFGGDLLGSLLGGYIGGGLPRMTKTEGFTNALQGSGDPLEQFLGNYMQKYGVNTSTPLSAANPKLQPTAMANSLDFLAGRNMLDLSGTTLTPQGQFGYANPVSLAVQNINKMQGMLPNSYNLSLGQMKQSLPEIENIVQNRGTIEPHGGLQGLLQAQNALAQKLFNAETY